MGELDAVDAVLMAASIALGLGYAAVCVGALAHYLVGAACQPAAHAHDWAEQADPDHLIPPPLRRPGVLVVVDGGRVREVRRG